MRVLGLVRGVGGLGHLQAERILFFFLGARDAKSEVKAWPAGATVVATRSS